MVSRQTLLELRRVLCTHVPDDNARNRLLTDLARVAGNRSFTDTVIALQALSVEEDRDTIPSPPPTIDDQPCNPALSMVSPLSDVDVSHIPVEQREWTIRVYRLNADGSRFTDETLARTFGHDEARARTYFERTQGVWNARAKGGEAHAFIVVLGIQDARKHKKKTSYREVETVTCDGKDLLD